MIELALVFACRREFQARRHAAFWENSNKQTSRDCVLKLRFVNVGNDHSKYTLYVKGNRDSIIDTIKVTNHHSVFNI